MTRYDFFATKTSVRPYATLIIDEGDLDEELTWIAEILDCKTWDNHCLPSHNLLN